MNQHRRGVFLILLTTASCSSSSNSPTTTDASGEVGTAFEAGASDAPSLDGTSDAADAGPASGTSCTSESPTAAPKGAGFSVQTSHYDVYAETTAADATEIARLLEASSGAFSAWFMRPPPSARMRVNYYKDDASFTAALAADGITTGPETGGYYSPTTKTAYLFVQGNPYYSHVLAVHEATHQYHDLTRLVGQPIPFWYAEGHAEYLSRHDWDGSCVRLGVTSLLSWEDLPAKAMAEGHIDVAGIVGGTTSATRADAWAIFRYLDTGDLHDKFRSFRDAFDANAKPSFASIVAAPDGLDAPIVAWIPTAQEPMQPIYTEWVHRGPHAIDVSTPGVFSIAVVKSTSVSHFQANYQAPSTGNWDVGVVVSYSDNTHYIGIVHGADGKVRSFTANGSAIWADLGTAPIAAGGVESFSVDQSGSTANVSFNGTKFAVPVTAPRMGLAANDTRGHFTDISWRP